MGVLYSVFPIDAEMTAYLETVGETAPESRQMSRNPTPLEIREVCGRLKDQRVQFFSPPNHAWQVMIEGRNDPEHQPWTLLNISAFNGDETLPHPIWFEKGWPSLILRVVRDLTEYCGTLVLVPDSGGKHVVLSSSSKVQEILRTWEHTAGIDSD